jgi:adenosylcobinamide kinase/adenosylcobinamide-phosphate guanylyltransferase
VGLDLSGIGLVALTQDDPDQTALTALRHRSTGLPILVAGHPKAVERCRDRSPGTELHPMGPGACLDWQGWRLRALAAQDDDAIILDIASPDGERLLYANGTGPFVDQSLTSLTGAAFDVVLLEESLGFHTDLGDRHLNLITFPAGLVRLRSAGAITDSTQVAAIRLSHHNPPPAELERILRSWNVTLPQDGAVLTKPATVTADSGCRRTLVLGGMRSGKSSWAESQLLHHSQVDYVATAAARDDADWAERLAQHQRRRPPNWRTVETVDLPSVLAKPHVPLLIDDLGNWVSRTMDATGGWDGDLTRFDTEAGLLVDAWGHSPSRAVLVSNEVGNGIHPSSRAGRIFVDVLGRLNASMAAASDEVVLITAAIPQWLRRPPTEPGANL